MKPDFLENLDYVYIPTRELNDDSDEDHLIDLSANDLEYLAYIQAQAQLKK
jgi:hypothetical protein